MQANHIDLWVANLRTGLYKAKRAGLAVKPIFALGNPADFEMWLACNKSTPDQTVNLLNDTLKKMRTDDTIDKILAKYN
jgi:ABC-type amino acid transport substrate-binding protein